VVLINSVLSAIPIFYLSFFKLPSCVRLEIISLQRNFLWGGTSGDGSKIPWVKWSDVCRPKKEGGLGVKDLKAFNLSLMAKWRWRLLVEEGSQWKNILSAKYGEVGGLVLGMGARSRASLWWRDLVGLGVVRGVPGDWLQEVFVKKLGNGSNTNFLHDIWCGPVKLAEVYPRLFKLSLQPDDFIRQIGVREDGVWVWQLKWRRPLFVWENEVLNSFLDFFASIPISIEDPSWEFRLDVVGGFSVKANYLFLAKKLSPPSPVSIDQAAVLFRVWNSWAPSKVIVFSWQLLLSRVPTLTNLASRGVVFTGGSSTCVLCGVGIETEHHLFLACPFAWKIWMLVCNWFGVVEVISGSISSFLEGFLASISKGKKSHKGILLVWHAVIWLLWRTRNEKNFQDKGNNVAELLDRIKRTSWEWLLAKKVNAPCMYYEWHVNPLHCIV
jgi:hypothetical protein